MLIKDLRPQISNTALSFLNNTGKFTISSAQQTSIVNIRRSDNASLIIDDH